MCLPRYVSLYYFATDYRFLTFSSEGTSQFVLKEIPQDWATRNDVYHRAADCHHIRLPIDTVPEKRMLVFKYSNEELLSLVQKDLPRALVKRILKSTFHGIAALHDVDIIHNDIKANNILVHIVATPTGIEVERVELTDLEDALHSSSPLLKGAAIGNWMWRSPEAHAKGPMNKPSDVFAFGIVCIYAMTKAFIFAVDNPALSKEDKIATVLFRQVSYFSAQGKSAFRGLLEYLGDDNPEREMLEAIEEGLKDIPREPFIHWQDMNLDDEFKDLVSRMCRLDPRERITAQEVLGHRWWKDV
ncbi:Hypothetical protein R9X50_00360300 [Acrodontium crateriforme]|uniref:Protein kinase domain-containing protein n=1 Tax=Acrodontium crateriforme TaxID=150365 RepID=A0AAQ3M616_9PEZI|nr:Hypothetical protein R9X50_00360300 [Acrodontium crateriforme]